MQCWEDKKKVGPSHAPSLRAQNQATILLLQEVSNGGLLSISEGSEAVCQQDICDPVGAAIAS